MTFEGENKYVSLQRCWAHLFREVKEILEKHPHGDVYLKAFKSIFRDLKEHLEDPPPSSLGKNPDWETLLTCKTHKHFNYLEDRDALKESLEKELTIFTDQLSCHKDLRKIANKIRNGMKYWFTCLTQPSDPTNNRAEEALREIVIIRKIMGSLKSLKGAQALATHLTIIEQLKQNPKHNIIEQLTDLIQTTNHHPNQ